MKGYKIYIERLCWVLITIPFFIACTTTRQTNLIQDKPPFYSAHPYEDYRLQNNDEIRCSVLTTDTKFADVFNGALSSLQATKESEDDRKANLSSTIFTIYENGCISIPYLGDDRVRNDKIAEIKVAGLTIPEAEAAIQKKLAMLIPDVQVRVVLNNNNYFTLSSNGGSRPQIYKENMTIFQALSVNKIPGSDDIDLSKVKIVRYGPDGHSIVKVFDLRTSSVLESEFYYIKPNDLIYYTTASRSFWRISSFQSFIYTVIAPLTFLAAMKSLKF